MDSKKITGTIIAARIIDDLSLMKTTDKDKINNIMTIADIEVHAVKLMKEWESRPITHEDLKMFLLITDGKWKYDVKEG